jgi:purine-binding chemotaxis protein CheW
LASSETTIAEPSVATRTLLFRVGSRVYGCDIDCVREIIPWRKATRLPGAPAHVQGLVNLRGTIVTVLDLAARLEPDAPPADGELAGRSIVLVEHGTRVVGAAVDEVMDVQDVVPEPVEEASGGARGGLVRGLGHLEGEVVVLLDIHMLITQVLL